MKIPEIKKQEPLSVEAGVSKLSIIEFVRIPQPALLKEPAHFWDEAFISNEAHILDEVTHPRIRKKLAFDVPAHRLFLEYIDAVTLYDLVHTKVTVEHPKRAHLILQSVAETVADLHAGVLCGRPIVHNDLKSMNILVPHDAPNDSRLIDFSHAYFRDHLPAFLDDKKEDRVGTAKYMSPEKWDGNYADGAKSDVFAFGVMAYYAHTGKHPFDGDLASIEKQIREMTPPTPLELGINVPRSTVVIIMSCLEKLPNRRPSMEYVAKNYGDSAKLFD